MMIAGEHHEEDAVMLDVQPSPQPVWVQTPHILQRILSYASFEEQSTTLRLVCQSFKVAALHCLEDKLLDQKWLPIAFTRYDACSWVRADARRGWSDDSMTTEEGVIDTALWMVSCRCLDKCDDKASCPGTTEQLDMDAAKQLLTEHGKFRLTSKGTPKVVERPSVEASLERKVGQNLYQICQQVHESIKKEVDYHYLPGSLMKYYGVEHGMSSKRFLCSLFLVFTDGTSPQDGHFPEVTIALASATVQERGGDMYSRKKMIFRFETASHEKVEICLEGKHHVY
ncbi:expressed unknown protein [Seminavis robusta]|uniref:F-box domain-containing protein n=1 Tax=Seminavis robusta TaxID=568900 RepID=A0A9N8DIY5_9STRA|nr:expressed unknown protein [Seminavis robusta]|eukprot:Sro177_g077920.1 n/a (284) ;mRNA; f:86416-87267